MKLENAIRILAGTMVLTSISLAHWVSEWWLLLAVFVGANLIQSAFTGFCPVENVFKKLGVGTNGSVCCLNSGDMPSPLPLASDNPSDGRACPKDGRGLGAA